MRLRGGRSRFGRHMVGRKSGLSTAEPARPRRYSSTITGAGPQPCGPSSPSGRPPLWTSRGTLLGHRLRFRSHRPSRKGKPPVPLRSYYGAGRIGLHLLLLWARCFRFGGDVGPFILIQGPGGGSAGRWGGFRGSSLKTSHDDLFRASRAPWVPPRFARKTGRCASPVPGWGPFRAPTCEGLANGAWSWAPPWLKSLLFTLPCKTARCHAIARRAGEPSEAPNEVGGAFSRGFARSRARKGRRRACHQNSHPGLTESPSSGTAFGESQTQSESSPNRTLTWFAAQNQSVELLFRISTKAFPFRVPPTVGHFCSQRRDDRH